MVAIVSNDYPLEYLLSRKCFREKSQKSRVGQREGVLCLIDDFLVIGKDLKENNKRPQRILEKLSESKITLNYDKCEFAKSEIKFLGEAIDQNGVRCDPLKVKAITEISQPNNRTGFLVWQTS